MQSNIFAVYDYRLHFKQIYFNNESVIVILQLYNQTLYKYILHLKQMNYNHESIIVILQSVLENIALK